MSAGDFSLRVSVATLDKVIFPNPRDGTPMLALERKATRLGDGGVYVCAQPYGGAVRLLNPDALRDLIGDFRFDSDRSSAEQDLRILIRPDDWASVRQFCLNHLQYAEGAILESGPDRELVEEFAETLQVDLLPDQYATQPIGFVVENEPTPSANIYSQGFPTVRIYRVFEVRILDDLLGELMLAASERLSDGALQTRAQNSVRGRANTVLTLPLHMIRDFYLGIEPDKRDSSGLVASHRLDVSVLALLDDVEVPRLQRV